MVDVGDDVRVEQEIIEEDRGKICRITNCALFGEPSPEANKTLKVNAWIVN